MKAKLVLESIQFKKTGNVQKSLSLGSYNSEFLDKQRKEVTDKLWDLGFSTEWRIDEHSLVMGDVWKLTLINKLNTDSERAHINAKVTILQHPEINKVYDLLLNKFAEKVGSKGTLGLLNNSELMSFEIFPDVDSLIKNYLTLEYSMCQDWDYFNKIQEIISIINS